MDLSITLKPAPFYMPDRKPNHELGDLRKVRDGTEHQFVTHTELVP